MTAFVRVGIAAACVALTLAGCSQATVLDGRAVSMRYDPYRVAGLPTSDGPSGPRAAPPSAADRVQNTDDGQIDREALLAVEDIEDFWSAALLGLIRRHVHTGVPARVGGSEEFG